MKHIPNILSAFRIVLIPFFIWQYLVGNTHIAAIILAVSGLTDLLDGFLARRFGWVSQLGKVLDPAADKLTQVAVCILLAIKMREYWPVFAFLLVKEGVMLLLGGGLLARGVKLEGAKWFGKVTTVLFYLSCALIIFFPEMPPLVGQVLLLLTMVSALVSGLMYIPEYVKYRRVAKAEKNANVPEALNSSDKDN